MSDLEFGRVAAASGKADSLVIFVHGYGADGNDLLSLSRPLAQHLPDTVFIAPNAPNRCSVNPMGYEWFPIPWLDGSSIEASEAGMADAAISLDRFVSARIAEEEVTSARTILIGFSQGTMMSLHVGPMRKDVLGGIVGFSGRLLKPELLAEAKSKPPVQLIHGDLDDVVPPGSMPEAEQALSAHGFAVNSFVSKGTAHGIAPDGMGVALAAIKGWLAA